MRDEEPSATCRCGRSFSVRREQVGGIVNCPACGQAVEVEGLNDPWWTASKVVAAVVFAGIVAAVYVNTHGLGPAAIAAAGIGFLILILAMAM